MKQRGFINVIHLDQGSQFYWKIAYKGRLKFNPWSDLGVGIQPSANVVLLQFRPLIKDRIFFSVGTSFSFTETLTALPELRVGVIGCRELGLLCILLFLVYFALIHIHDYVDFAFYSRTLFVCCIYDVLRVSSLKGQCHKDFAVLDQFCARIITSRLYSWTKCFCKATTKISNEFYQRGLTIIKFLRIFWRRSIKIWLKKLAIFFKFQSISILAIRSDRPQKTVSVPSISLK